MSHARTIEGMKLETANQEGDLALLRARDAATWEALFDRMYPRMLAYAERRVGSREDARDAVSEAFARMVKSLDEERPTKWWGLKPSSPVAITRRA